MSEETRQVTPKEAERLFDKSHATIYAWRNKYNWKTEQDAEGKSVFHIPVSFIRQRSVHQFDNPLQPQSQGQVSNLKEAVLDSPVLVQLLQTQNEILQALVKNKDEVDRLNREIENRGNAIVKYKEQERTIQDLSDTVKRLESEVQALKAEPPRFRWPWQK